VGISPHKYKRTHPIDRITVHHMAGDLSVEGCAAAFQTTRTASANYGIGSDGRIACYVPEDYRSLCSCSFSNDDRAINIEVANCTGSPDWKVSDKAFAALMDLCADICKRYGFRLRYTGDSEGNLTVHRWFANTLCPGPYLMGKLGELVQRVNARLQDVPEQKVNPVELWQKAAMEDGYDFPLFGADGIWGDECRAVARQAVVKRRRSYELENLTRWVQKQLGITADGLCGTQTDAAIRAYQRAHGLTPDGAAGVQTYASLLHTTP
jgi:peptidoglycan hydrolase-like protein with peptidoglycan-binding domain